MALPSYEFVAKISYTYLLLLAISFSCLIPFNSANAINKDEAVAASSDVRNNVTPFRNSAQQFLYFASQRINGETIDDGLSENFITGLDKIAIDLSDFIKGFSFLHQAAYERGRRFEFYVPEAFMERDPTEYLQLAVLRIYKKRTPDKKSIDDEKFTITVYSIIETFNGVDVLNILTSIMTTANYQGWLEMTVTESLKSWLQDSTKNLSIYIKAHAVAKPDIEVLDNIGLVYTEDDKEHQLFMIGFFKLQKLIRKKENSNFYDYPANEVKKPCKLHRLSVSFSELGLDHWIAPPGFDANYCSGVCNFPIGSNFNAINHTTIMSLLHAKRSDVPAPCCVPIEFEGLAALSYENHRDDVVLRFHKNMKVKSCGCR